MYTVAIVEDEKNLASLVIKYLCAESYNVKWYSTGEDALKGMKEETIDLWILDIMLPGIVSGYDLIKLIREQTPTMPVIFTSARDQDIDKIMGLELGSDDYLAKPYSIRELVLRVKNLLLRTYQYNNIHLHKNEVAVGEYMIDKDRRSVMFKGEGISLTSKEYDLLLFLVNHPGKAFSRDQILNEVWGEDYFGSDRVVDDLLRRLRQKMPELQIETIYGFGYRMML
ncbi:MAG: response regulator transcription factor [Anaeroplasmataceae bacterium]|nr:response regulator transcription factor [Anaeroplasmataceae bacterium]MDE6242155.1 response regulator transcription factor [Anaeroplasmataceae bacterium]